MSFVDEEDQLVQNSLNLLEMLNPDMDRIQFARGAILASNGNVDDAVVLLQKNAVKHVYTKGYATPLDATSPELGWHWDHGSRFAKTDPPRLHYMSTPQLKCLVQTALATFPEFALSFPQFDKLPTEIRMKIWALALPRGRNIFIKPYLSPFKQCAPPALLSVNRESRDVALATFRLCILRRSPSFSAIYVNINHGLDHLFVLQLVKGCRELLEVKVKGGDLVKGHGEHFRYSKNSMDISVVIKWPHCVFHHAIRPIPWALWEEFINAKNLKKKVWVRDRSTRCGRLTRI